MTSRFDWCEVTTLGDLLVRGAQQHPDRVAVAFTDSCHTYAELYQGAVTIARGLHALGIQPGEHVGLMAANSPEFIEALFAIAFLGCVTVPLNARHKATELAYITTNANLVAILTTANAEEYVDFTSVFRTALPELSQQTDPTCLALTQAPLLRNTVLLRGDDRSGFLGRPAFDVLAGQVSAEDIEQLRRRVRVRDIAIIMYTSGTTAHPKGCMLSHEAMTRGPVDRASTRLAVAEHDVSWGAGPLFHIGSLAPFVGSIGAGGTYLTDHYFEAGRALKLLAEHHATVIWPWFPAIVQALIDHPDFDSANLKSIERVVLIGPKPMVERVQRLFPQAEVAQACGMTETAGIFALSNVDESPLSKATTQGRAVPGIEVKIASLDTGGVAAPGEVGEILVRGYCVMEGYYNDEAKTREAMDREGWLHTGDLYSATVDGSLVFSGRLKDMLKVGGENVAAIEIEAFLCEHPAVKLAEVVGSPDDRLDEVPIAFVELRAGHELQAAELIAFCNGRIASFKIPRAVYFMTSEQWPMSATKVDKRALRALIADAHSPQLLAQSS
ncbi:MULTISPECIES: class I adenylate-forming enzyme family protein [Pseudomonas]|uniref:AMP-binding protein n=1 Tax=Pseudomonas monteilii TaxID=76759 RepID=A0AAE6V3X1_9PSED|nr:MULTISPECIES: class I adenylate-forming enzyme family protein [Pseudomonas]MDH4549895.1 acyl--CoA ligase [Pseudomonas sp. BN607]MDH4846093.1 acyl--CoA ligase [Pseudomonas sp. BN605]MDH4858765.1 acyl--CoA ligase [Pseudomonas sp. BN505]NWL08044.1 fatty acid--CoA ligase [Pseudomonas hunanensis]QHB28807.1 AMP-binding protein [Pseudomonas monteilii]